MKAHAQPKDAPYIWEYLLPYLETLPELKVSEKNEGGKRSYLNMRSLFRNLCEIEGVKHVLTPRWVVLVAVCFPQFTGIFHRLPSLEWSTGRPTLDL